MKQLRDAGLNLAISIMIVGISESSVSAMNTAQMQEAMERHMCPADPVEISLLNYTEECGPQPEGSSSRYLQCQNHVDAENNTISAYNEFVRNCSSKNGASMDS